MLGVGLLVLALLVLVLAAAPLLRLLSPRLLLSLLAMFLGENISRGGGRKNAKGCRRFPRFCNPTKLDRLQPISED